MKRIIIALSILIFASFSLQATIRILSTTPATACDGSIHVEASGTAGPFRLKVSAGSTVVYDVPMSAATATVPNLCAGSYTVEVFNAYGCAKTLLAEVSAGAGILSQLSPQKQSEQVALPSIWQAKAYPNPFNTDFQIDLQWDRPEAEEIQVEVLNALGQIIKSQRQGLVLGRNVFRVELNDPSSRGLLQVVLRDKGGRQVWLKVVQVQR